MSKGEGVADFPKAVRLLKPAEFRKTYDEGDKWACPLFAVFSRRGEGAEAARFGFTCPRALGKAVKRNRIKRRLRECVRLRRERFPAGIDIVFNPRKALLDAPWAEIERQVERYLSRLGSQQKQKEPCATSSLDC